VRDSVSAGSSKPWEIELLPTLSRGVRLSDKLGCCGVASGILLLASFLCSLPTTMSIVVPADPDPKTNVTGADEEPQNALTQKFTEKEWAALKEFRVRVANNSHPFCALRASPLLRLSFQIY
jgi:hypothetical protein